MPRYHFNVYDGVSIADREGTELVDIRSARREAVALAGSIIEEEADKLRPGRLWHMEVTDADGLLLLRLDFQMTAFPLWIASAEAEPFGLME